MTQEKITNSTEVNNNNQQTIFNTLSTYNDYDKQMYIIHRVLKQQLNNNRQRSAHTKTRSEVKGGGKKPWKQKGTGRARAGSTRSPLWRGGGVIFGPRVRNYAKKINKKEKRLAIKLLIYNKLKNITIVNNLFENLHEPSTKVAVSTLEQFGIQQKKSKTLKTLLITTNSNYTLYLSIRNLYNVELATVNNINMFSLIKADKILITSEALKKIQTKYEK